MSGEQLMTDICDVGCSHAPPPYPLSFHGLHYCVMLYSFMEYTIMIGDGMVSSMAYLADMSLSGESEIYWHVKLNSNAGLCKNGKLVIL